MTPSLIIDELFFIVYLYYLFFSAQLQNESVDLREQNQLLDDSLSSERSTRQHLESQLEMLKETEKVMFQRSDLLVIYYFYLWN